MIELDGVLLSVPIYDVPFGAEMKLPPPSYLCKDGKERKSQWVEVTNITDTSRRFIAVHVDTTGWGCLVGSN